MAHFFIGVLEERNGEYEYQVPVCFTTSTEEESSKVLTNAAQNWYGNCSHIDGDCYFFYGGEVCVRAGSYKEISKIVYNEIAGYIAEVSFSE